MEAKKSTKVAKKAPKRVKHIGMVAHDPYLEPFEEAIRGRHEHYLWKLNQFTGGGKRTLAETCDGYNYYGLHRDKKGWVFREWAPNATDIYLVGDFNDWQEGEEYHCQKLGDTGTGSCACLPAP